MRNLDSNLIHITSENSKYSIEEIFDDRGIKYYTLSQYENLYVLRDYGISAIANAIDIYLKSKLGPGIGKFHHSNLSMRSFASERREFSISISTTR